MSGAGIAKQGGNSGYSMKHPKGRRQQAKNKHMKVLLIITATLFFSTMHAQSQVQWEFSKKALGVTVMKLL
jgi:hypothetical protein